MPVRPKSIVQFEFIFLTAIVLGLVQALLQWNQLAADPRIAAMVDRFGNAPLVITAFVLVVIQLLLWYFVARRASNVARWIFVVLTAYIVISGIFELASAGAILEKLVGIIGVALIVLQAIAIFLLFRADARAWFQHGEAVA